MTYKYHVLTLLLLVCFASSLILTITPVPPICEAGCDVVQTSQYASTLGVKNSLVGTIVFAFLALTSFRNIKRPTWTKRIILKISIIIGSAISLYFLYIQIFILQAYCKYCLIVDFSILAALLTILFYKKWKIETS